jgi:hypothetical protein
MERPGKRLAAFLRRCKGLRAKRRNEERKLNRAANEQLDKTLIKQSVFWSCGTVLIV